MNTQAAPRNPPSWDPPISAVLPSADRATAVPESLSPGPPMNAVLPSEESATLVPNPASPLSSLGTIFSPCCVQVEPERVNTHAPPLGLHPAPSPQASGVPMSAVLPSEDS